MFKINFKTSLKAEAMSKIQENQEEKSWLMHYKAYIKNISWSIGK